MPESDRIPAPISFASLRRSISWDEVERMLGSVDRQSAVGRRDYAVLLPFMSSGLPVSGRSHSAFFSDNIKTAMFHAMEKHACRRVRCPAPSLLYPT